MSAAGPAPVWVVLFAGFANRLFQVAAGLQLARRLGRPMRVVAHEVNHDHGGNNYDVLFERVPGGMGVRLLPWRAPHVLTLLREQGAVEPHVVTNDCSTFLDPIDVETLAALPGDRPILLNGYFQNKDNICEVREDMRRWFGTPLPRIEQYLQTAPPGFYERVVAIHVRLGDYLFTEKLCIPLQAYYKRAMDLAREAFPDTRFVITTDDPKRVFHFYPDLQHSGSVLAVLQSPAPDVVEHPDLVGFYLMVQARGVICANSTYSWMAAWLNARPDVWVTVPAQWARSVPGRTLDMGGARVVEV